MQARKRLSGNKSDLTEIVYLLRLTCHVKSSDMAWDADLLLYLQAKRLIAKSGHEQVRFSLRYMPADIAPGMEQAFPSVVSFPIDVSRRPG